MPVNSVQFRRTVGLFNNQNALFSTITMHQYHIMTFCTCYHLVLLHLVSFRFTSPLRQFRTQTLPLAFAIKFSFICIFHDKINIWLYTRKIDLGGRIEKNPGRMPSSSQRFSICHWNLNGITVHSYVKISLLKAYLSSHKFD